MTGEFATRDFYPSCLLESEAILLRAASVFHRHRNGLLFRVFDLHLKEWRRNRRDLLGWDAPPPAWVGVAFRMWAGSPIG